MRALHCIGEGGLREAAMNMHQVVGVFSWLPVDLCGYDGRGYFQIVASNGGKTETEERASDLA